LDPLYHTIDPESLDDLFADRALSHDQSLVHVSFNYAGYQVTVSHDGSVDVSPTPGESARAPDATSAHHPSGDSEAPD
jgi:hypothetical protein